MPSIATWKKLQAASGLVFGFFLLLHLISHISIALVGWENSLITYGYVRAIYQFPLVEAMIFLALGVHMASSTTIYLSRRRIESKQSNSHKKNDDADTSTAKSVVAVPKELMAHRYTGYFLSLAVGGHAFATRAAPLLSMDDPSLYDYNFIKLSIDSMPFSPSFSIYLALFGMAGNWHMVYGAYSAVAVLQNNSVRGKPIPLPLKVGSMLIHILLIVSVLTMTIHNFNYVIPAPNDAIQQGHTKIVDFMGI